MPADIESLTIEAVCNLAMQGHGATHIAKRLNIPENKVKGIISREFVFPPSQIGRTMRPASRSAPLTPEIEARICELHEADTDWKEIAAATGVSYSSVVTVVNKAGLAITRRRRPWTIADYDFLIENVDKPDWMLAELLDRSEFQVRYRYVLLRRMGLPIPARKRDHVAA